MCISRARWFVLTSCLAWLIICDTAIADEPAAGEKYLLRYKLAAGDVLRYEVDHRAVVRSTIKGTSEIVRTESKSTRAWKVLDVLDSGEIEFGHVVERVYMKNQLPNRAATEYDSERDETPPLGYEQAAAAVGVTLTIHRIKPNGEVIKRTVKHKQPGQDENPLPITIPLPEEAVAVGHKWDEPHRLTIKIVKDSQRVETRRHFKLASVENGIATIEADYQVLTPVSATVKSQLAQRLTSGKIRFDIERGVILDQQHKVDERVVGFAGPESSMHYRSRFTEKLVDGDEKRLAAKAE